MMAREALQRAVAKPAQTLPLAGNKPSAVLIAVVQRPSGPTLVMLQKTSGMRSHAGQIGFPGGGVEAGETSEQAALREAWEEIGLPIDRVDIIGMTRAYATGSGYLITPVVGVIPEGLELVPHEAEVARVFEVPLDHLVAENNHLRRTAVYNDIERHYFEIDWPHEYIWGVTAGLIVNLAPRLREAIRSAA